jgi:ring-1,2-phenylacetyl-CoA epoxidase subunit PaaC
MSAPEWAPLLAARLLALGDDELVLAQRDGEWTGHAPILEEDIAFTNIALDEMGHAQNWYALLAELGGEPADRLIFFRPPAGFRNCRLVELPRGDWAFSMLRQFLFDAYERLLLPHLASSAYRPLAETAAKIRTEELYHFRHSQSWITRLAQGTAESRRRLMAALDELWPYCFQLFDPLPGEEALVAAGITPPLVAIRAEWQALVEPFLLKIGLAPPTAPAGPGPGREHHTASFAGLIAELQATARLEPDGQW